MTHLHDFASKPRGRFPSNDLMDAMEKSGLHDESKALNTAIKAWENAPRPRTEEERDYGKRAQAAEAVEDHLNRLKKHGLTQSQVNGLSDSILQDRD